MQAQDRKIQVPEVHNFFGLEGLPQQLLPRASDAVKRPDELHTDDLRPWVRQSRHSTAFNAPGLSLLIKGGERPHSEAAASPPPMSGGRANRRSKWDRAFDVRKERESVDYLRQMSFEEDNRTLFHDLITPHRSYAFRARGPPPSSGQQARRRTITPAGLREDASAPMSSSPTDMRAKPDPLPAQRTLPAQRNSAQEKDLWISQPIQKVKVNRVDYDAEKRSLRTSDSHLRTATWENKNRVASLPKPTQPRVKPEKGYKFKPKTMMVLSQEFSDQNARLQNDLAGPFQNPAKIRGVQYCGPGQRWEMLDRPAVRSLSSFEEYLERTVNSIRGDSQIAFHPSQGLAHATLSKDQFLSRRTAPSRRRLSVIHGRSSSAGLDRLDFQAASTQLSAFLRRAKWRTCIAYEVFLRAALYSFLDIYYSSAPWMVDPALFVRVFADAIHGQEALNELEAYSSPHSSPRSSPKMPSRSEEQSPSSPETPIGTSHSFSFITVG